MPEQDVIVIRDEHGTEHEFPAGFDPVKAAAIVRGSSTPPSQEAAVSAGPGALAMGAARTAAPAFLRGVENFATSPTAGKTTSAIANALTTVGGLGHGLYTGNLNEIVAAPIAGWQAGKGGYWLGKRAQSLAAPVARGMGAAAPYASAIAGPLNMAAGVGELAQIAEPNRRDIGFSTNDPGDPNHPALLNYLISKLTGR